jgi:hypothetical protein
VKVRPEFAQQRNEMIIKARKIDHFATQKGWEIFGSELRVQVGRTVSYLDRIYRDPRTDTFIHIEAKTGYRGFLDSKKAASRPYKVERDKHMLQVVGGCLSWNKELEMEGLNGKLRKELGRRAITDSYIYYVDSVGPIHVPSKHWPAYENRVKRRWRLKPVDKV